MPVCLSPAITDLIPLPSCFRVWDTTWPTREVTSSPLPRRSPKLGASERRWLGQGWLRALLTGRGWHSTHSEQRGGSKTAAGRGRVARHKPSSTPQPCRKPSHDQAKPAVSRLNYPCRQHHTCGSSKTDAVVQVLTRNPPTICRPCSHLPPAPSLACTTISHLHHRRIQRHYDC